MKVSTIRGPSLDNIRSFAKKKKGQLGFLDEYLRVLAAFEGSWGLVTAN